MKKIHKVYLEKFGEDGFILVKGLLDWERDLRPLQEEYSVLLDALGTQWLREGKIARYDETANVPARFNQLLLETEGKAFQHFEISLPQENISETTPMHLGKEVFALLNNEKLLDVVEALIGGEIYCNPVQHVRVKPPEREFPPDSQQCLTSRTFWHQDLGVITEDADESHIISVFVPLTNTTVQNGCIQVIPGSHKAGLTHHCRSVNANGIPESTVDNERPIEMQVGDILLFDKLTKHASLPNLSSSLRWSFDLRYNRVGEPTGRSCFPGFVARSKVDPASVQTDYDAWVNAWHDARATLSGRRPPRFTRWDWDPDNPSQECPLCDGARS